ncbi:hypothetical protein [Pedobacter sp. BMA]|uniref:hypothetical protein n=1 Tax=Pedobacter sp. BMA TaxID=1663685 RepID=UPI0006498E60|nr:hypothetical protein [Pedobacter sp. BMA]KLT63900.1 hypothetical protein AB669_19410 [Pedobacter sp. BMA]
MNIDDFSFHDSQIIEVRETSGQTIDFLIHFCTEWKNNVFEKRILRFKDVIYYNIDEIPVSGQPTILEIVNFGQLTKIFGTGTNQIEVVRNKVEMQTTSGIRTIEYSECDLVIPPNNQ